jgi:hypothetical protein
MKTGLLAIAAALILSSCNPGGERIEPKRVNTAFTIEVHMDTVERVRDWCTSVGAWPSGSTGRQEVGCARFFLDRNHCEVHVPTPAYVDDKPTEVLGHEVLHCVYGRYHP